MKNFGPVLAAVLAVGCYQASEGEGDGGAVLDAGRPVDATPGSDGGSECVPVSVSTPALACPASVAVGETAVVRVTGAHDGCCSSGMLVATVSSFASHVHELELGGSVCDCCELCPCVGPTLTTDVALDGLAPGTHTVRAGEASCTFDVLALGACRPLPVDEVRAPEVLFPGQTFGLTAWAASAGCGCMPGLTPSASGFDAQLCDCCDMCDCVDQPYEVGHLGAPPAASPFEVGGVTVEVERRELASCREVEAALEVVPPRDDVRRGGPAIWWVRMRGESPYAECCGALAGIERSASGREHRVALRDCTPACRCAGPPAQLDAWLPLGELEPGTHRVIAPGAEAIVVNVP